MEEWFCLNCDFPTSLSIHGVCERCGSSAVDCERPKKPLLQSWVLGPEVVRSILAGKAERQMESEAA